MIKLIINKSFQLLSISILFIILNSGTIIGQCRPSGIGGNGTACVGQNQTFWVTGGSNCTNGWASGIGNFTINSGSFTLKWNSPGTYEINVGETNHVAWKTITVYPSGSTSAGIIDNPNESICSGRTVQPMRANGVVGDIQRWQKRRPGVSWNNAENIYIDSPTLPASEISNTEDYDYRIYVYNRCTNTTRYAYASVDVQPRNIKPTYLNIQHEGGNVTSVIDDCNGPVYLSASNNGSNMRYEWYRPNEAWPSSTSSTFAISNPMSGRYTLKMRWNDNCSSDAIVWDRHVWLTNGNCNNEPCTPTIQTTTNPCINTDMNFYIAGVCNSNPSTEPTGTATGIGDISNRISGESFTLRWSTPGIKTITIRCDCGDIQKSIDIQSSAISAGAINNPNTDFCAGSTPQSISVTGYLGDPLRWEKKPLSQSSWTGPNTETIHGADATLPAGKIDNENTFDYRVIVYNSCAAVDERYASTRVEVKERAGPEPSEVIIVKGGSEITSHEVICDDNNPIAVSAQIISFPITYKWFEPGSAIPISTNKDLNITNPKLGQYKVEATWTDECNGLTKRFFDTFRMNFNECISYQLCTGQSLRLQVPTGNSVSWYNDAGPIEIIHFGPTYDTPEIFENKTYTALAFNADGSFTRYVYEIVVLDKEYNLPNAPYLVKNENTYDIARNNTDDGNYTYWWVDDPLSTSGFQSEVLTNVDGNRLYYLKARNQQGCFGPALTIRVPGDLQRDVFESSFTYDQSNYIRQHQFLTDGIIDINMATAGHLETTTTYYDGLGRKFQTISEKNSPDEGDILTYIDYSAAGDILFNYLPMYRELSSTNPLADPYTSIGDFYLDSDNTISDSNFPYSYEQVESNSLRRVIRSSTPGEDWELFNGRNIRYNYLNNVTNEVHLFKMMGNEITFSEYYNPGLLQKTIITDEQDHQVIEFTNKLGQTILKRVQVNEAATEWADTYYVYDDFGNLRYVLPPEFINNYTSQWIDLVGVEVNESYNIIKAGSTAWGNAGAASATILPPNTNGWAQYTEILGNTTNTNRKMFGLSTTNADANYTSLGYAMHTTNGGEIRCWKDGNEIYNSGILAQVGDVLRLERVGSTMYYKHNGVVIHSVSCDFSTPLMVDVAIYHQGASFGSISTSFDLLARWAFQYHYDGRRRMIEKKVPGADWVHMVYDDRDRLVLTQDGNQRLSNHWLFTKYDALNRPIATGLYTDNLSRVDIQQKMNVFYDIAFTWTNLSGVTVDDNIITKTTNSGWNGNGVSHLDYLADGEDGGVYVKATETNKSRFFGFETGTISHRHEQLEYSFYLASGGSLQIRENNTIIPGSHLYKTGDLLAIERTNDRIYYKKNSVILYESQAPFNGALSIDMAFYHGLGTLQFIQPSPYEEKGDIVFDYTNNSFPYVAEENDYLTLTYYDDYNFHHANLPQYGYQSTTESPTHFDRVKGQVTGSMTKVLGKDKWLRSVNYYDDRYRLIQQVADNALGGVDRTTNEYDFVGKVLKTTTSHDLPTPILWTKRDEIVEENGVFTSITTANWGSGMSSINKLPAGQDGYFETVITDLSGYRFVGFNELDEKTSHAEIDYRLYFYGKSLRFYDANGLAPNQVYQTLKKGDVIRLERFADIVTVYQNGQMVYTYSNPSTTDLVIDVSLTSNNGSVGYFTTNLQVPEIEYPYPVFWTGLNNMIEGNNSLTKTSNGWNGNASSLNKLAAYEDGWVEFEATSTDKALMFGLSEHDLNSSYNLIDYAIYLMTNGDIRVYEDGVNIGTFGTYQIGDVFRINRAGTIIQYIQNGIVIYESQKPSETSLIADVSFNTTGTSVININSSFLFDIPEENDVEITRTFDYDHAGRLIDTHHQISKALEWTNLVNVTEDNGTLTTQGETMPFSAEGLHHIAPYVNGGISYKFHEAGGKIIALNWEGNTNEGACLVYYNNSSRPLIRVNGAFVKWLNTSDVTSDFRIERNGDKIQFYENGSLVHELTLNVDKELIPEVRITQAGTTVKNVSIHQPRVLLYHNEYNELGELIEKNLHQVSPAGGGAVGGEFAQSTDYRYNIRGWLTSINNSDLSDGEDDYFGMDLAYNTALTGITTTPQFNGNISAVAWSDDFTSNPSTLGYGYSYDPMNRITKAQSYNANPNAFNLNAIGYDLNGNIENLTRMNASGAAMDVLTYNYGTGASKSNQLLGVTDTAMPAVKEEGFKDGNAGDDYLYDANGNMTSDLNKDITSITYNHLNLPEVVEKADGQRIRYVYDATGVKLSQHVEVGETIYESDFSSNFDGFGSFRIGQTANQDGILGEDDAMRMVTISSTGAHYINKSLPIQMKQTKVSFDIYIPSTNSLVDGASIIIGSESQLFDVVLDQWNRLEFEALSNINLIRIYQTVNGAASFTGVGDLSYIKNVVVTVYDTNSTDYSGEFIYETDEEGIRSLSLIQHEEGRIVPDEIDGGYDYEYYLKDHLGNTRVVFTTDPKIITFTANYENDPNNPDDQSLFEEVQVSAIKDFNRTTGDPNYTNSQVLRSSPNSQIGSAIAIPVGQGDKITAKAYAKYMDAAADPNVTGVSIASALVSAFTGAAPSGLEAGTSTINNNFGSSSLIGSAGFDYDATAPKAFLNLMFLPEDAPINLVKDASFAYDQIANGTTEAVLNGISENAYDELLIDAFEAPASGYVMVYLSNEGSLSDIYFDDIAITVEEHPVIEKTDYYPFGLAHSGGYQRVTAKENRFKFSGKERIDDLDLGWDDFGARMYDPAIGRWNHVDPLSEKYASVSPYNYVLNNPTKLVDPNGEDVYLLIWATSNGTIGHAGIAVDNYKTQEKKDEDGNTVYDDDGNAVTEQVKDGTVTYYDLWPSEGVGVSNASSDVDAAYQEFQVSSIDDLKNTDVSGSEGYAADGVIQITTDYETDQNVVGDLGSFRKNNKSYNGVECNCSDYAKKGIETATGKELDASERILFYKSTTPNKLYKQTLKQQGTKVLKDPGSKVNKSFTEGVKER